MNESAGTQSSTGIWNPEKVRALTRDERRMLRANALARDSVIGRAIVELCESVDAEVVASTANRPSSRNPLAVVRTGSRKMARERLLAEDIVAKVADKLAKLPYPERVENATRRMWRGNRRVETLADLC
jgi:hypothetical protein